MSRIGAPGPPQASSRAAATVAIGLLGPGFGMFPGAEIHRILGRLELGLDNMTPDLPKSPMKRPFSLSIGQLTFGSFLLVLAVIIITSTASVIAIRHIDSTFAELQRLQSVGDLAEDIDRRMNELRLAARDFVTDPGTQSVQVGDAAARPDRGPEEDPAGARPRTAGHDRRRHRAPADLPQRHRADLDADQSPGRIDRGIAAAPRHLQQGGRRQRPTPISRRRCRRCQSRIAPACSRTIHRRRNRPRKACGR